MRQTSSTEERLESAPLEEKADKVGKGEAGRAGSGSQTLLRGLDVLEAAADGSVPLAELAATLGLTRSTTHRLANALVERRYLTLVSGRGYQLGPKLLELGYLAQKQADIVVVAKPVLAALAEETGLPAFLGERDGDQSVNLLSVPGRQRVAVTTPVGTRRELAETSLGRALLLDGTEDEWRHHVSLADPDYCAGDWLAAMRRSAVDGVVLVAGPPPDHVRAVATPVRNAFGQIVAAISTVTVSQYMDVEEIARFAPQLREAADRISAELGHRQTSASTRR
jgi:DNA-binding IclR family transcriptional regulator